MELREGDYLGTYRIISPLGRGGMATVYKAHHERLDRFVAIKLMHSTFLQDEDFRARFQREARIVAKLEHPAIVSIYDYDEHQNTPYLVMKYIEGMTLKKRYIKTGLTIEEIETFMTRVAEGLDYAHSKGILHRDIKPSNILIDANDQPYITDFGLARIAEAGASTISHDMMLGTPYYISPEQAQGSKDLDNRTDVYSLGVILYELLTGQVPFQADTPYAIVHGHIYTEPELPSKINADLSSGIDRVLTKALAKARDDRYPNAVAMMKDFSRAIAGQPVTPSQASAVQGPPSEATNERSDIGNVVVSSNRMQPTPPAPPRAPVVESPQGKSKGNFSAEVDLGDFSWEQVRAGISTGAQSLAEMIEERIDTELRNRRGIALTDEEMARRRVMKRRKERQDFIGHLSSYIMVNGFLIAIWFFTGAGFFWPFFPLFFWGMGVGGQAIQYYTQYGPGASKYKEKMRQEVERELEDMNNNRLTTLGKPKNEVRLTTGYADEQRNAQIRLNEEGELTDSFVEEQQRYNR